MEKFAEIKLSLEKDVKKGDKESLLSLFSVMDRFKRMEVLKDAEANTPVTVILEGLGQAELKLGDDMEQGMQRTIMTLFWFVERSKLMEMQ
ncbi:MAG: hypothetical protein PHU23_03590, partial [Dehalococcoidales bacterium]|nr:hypothetical protein [Dehalococcoidales bacterium]